MSPDPLGSPPEVAAPAAYVPPVPTAFTLDNGVSVWLLNRPGLPLVSVEMLIMGGSAEDPAKKPGLAQLTDSLLMHGAGERDAAAFAEYSEQLAIQIDTATGGTSTSVYVETHAERLPQALDLLADVVLRPRLDKDSLERVRDQQIGDLQQGLDDPRTVASWVASRLYFGEGHPLAHPPSGTEDGLDAVKLSDVKASWKSRYVASRARIVVVGAVEEAALKEALQARFGAWAAGKPAAEPPPPAGVSNGPSFALVDQPGATQSVLRVTLPGWRIDDPGYTAGNLASIALGGTFTSRLNRLMREEKGYTYGAGTRLQSARGYGTVIASAAVQGEATAEALTDMLGELARAQEGFTADEASKALGAYRTGVIEAMESTSDAVSTFAQLAVYGLPPTDLRDRLSQATAVDRDAMQAAWRQAALPGALVVVVGNAATIEAPLKQAVPGDWKRVEKE